MKLIKIIYNKIKNLFNDNITIGNKSGIKTWNCMKTDKKSYIIAKNFSTRKNCHIEAKNGGKIIIGNGVHFNYNCIVASHKSISIGNDCLFGPNVIIYDHDHNYRDNNWRNEFVSDSIVIGKNVWIGGNVTILRGTVIGDNCVIAAGTILRNTKINNNTLVYNTHEISIKNIDTRKVSFIERSKKK